MSIVIVITPVDAKKRGGGHDRGGGHSDKGDKGGHGGHGHGHGGHDNGDDNGNDNGNGDPGPTNGGGGQQSRDRGGGGECASVDGINPCFLARPATGAESAPVEIAPGVFQYYGAFGQVIGTTIITLDDPTSSPAIVPRETIQEPEPVVDTFPEVRKRTILPPEKSADTILDVLIIQALERPVEPVQSLPPCQCEAQ